MKHGIKNLPYSIIREKKRQTAVAVCGVEGCNSRKEIALSKWLPASVVCRKINESGWESKGHFRPGIPGSFICPKHEKDNKAVVSDHVGEEYNVLPTDKVLDIGSIKMSLNLAKRKGADTGSYSVHFVIPTDVWEALGNKPRAFVVANKGNNQLTIQASESDGNKIVHSSQTKREVVLPINIKHLENVFPRKSVGRMEVEVFLQRDSGTILIPHIPEELTSQPDEAQSKSLKATREPASHPHGGQIYTVDDGSFLREQLNGWLEYMEAQNWNPQVEVRENRIYVSVQKTI